jgi:hypothetical protein
MNAAEELDLRISTLVTDPPLQASRWQRQPVLLSFAEMERLFVDLEQPLLLLMGRFYTRSDFKQHKDQFLHFYRTYVDALSQGQLPDEELCRQYFSAAFSTDTEPFYLLSGAPDKYLLRHTLPIIQLQYHQFSYSPLDGQVRSMVYGQETISWGIQFSYPQMYIEPIDKNIRQTNANETINAQLFRHLQRWLRQNTVPTPLIADERHFNAPIRLGKECISWIQRHPQLNQYGLAVDGQALNHG